MDAVIMAGGRGSRLAPYTAVLPKPLMPLDERPILEVVLDQLEAAGADRITLCVGHMSGIIQSWVAHARQDGVPIDFVFENQALGTAGALANLDPVPTDPFLAMNGDILTTLDYGALTAAHADAGAIATMATNVRTTDVQYGVVHADGDGRVVRLEEKPVLSYTVSMGVYAMSPEIVGLIEPGERIDFPQLLERAIAHGRTVGTFAFDGYWRDIGNPSDYEQAIADFGADPGRFLPAP